MRLVLVPLSKVIPKLCCDSATPPYAYDMAFHAHGMQYLNLVLAIVFSLNMYDYMIMNKAYFVITEVYTIAKATSRARGRRS